MFCFTIDFSVFVFTVFIIVLNTNIYEKKQICFNVNVVCIITFVVIVNIDIAFTLIVNIIKISIWMLLNFNEYLISKTKYKNLSKMKIKQLSKSKHIKIKKSKSQ